ncbi:hypothetical protein Tco_0047947 [Tanacetum coccineum]
MASVISKIKKSFQDMLRFLQLVVLAGGSSASGPSAPTTAKGEKPFENVHIKPLTMIHTNGIGERMSEYEVHVPISSVKPLIVYEIFKDKDATKAKPSSLNARSSKDVKGKKKMFEVTREELNELLQAQERKNKVAHNDVASTKEIAKLAYEEVKENKQVIKTTIKFKLLQLQEVKEAKEKLKQKEIIRKNV